MKFKKEELGFLRIFSHCSDTKREIHDKFQISVDKENKRVTFSQFSFEADIITVLDKDIEEESFTVIYPVVPFCELLKCSSDGLIVEITKDGVQIGDNSIYRFESYDYSIPDVDYFFSLIKEKPKKEYLIEDLDKLRLVKNFIGDGKHSYISILNNHFVTFDESVYGAALTKNNISETIYFPQLFSSLMNFLKVKSIKMSLYEGSVEDSEEKNKTFVFKIEDTYISFNTGDYSVSDIFTEETKKKYLHPDIAKVDKKDFIKSLQRIKILAMENIENRLFVSFKKDKIILESTDNDCYAKEEIAAIVDEKLQEYKIVISVANLYTSVDLIQGETIVFHVLPNDEAVGICVESDNKDTFYIIALYEVIESTA